MIALSFLVFFTLIQSTNSLCYLNRGRYAKHRKRSWRCFSFDNVVGKMAGECPWPIRSTLSANQGTVLQRNPKQTFFQLMGMIPRFHTTLPPCFAVKFPFHTQY